MPTGPGAGSPPPSLLALQQIELNLRKLIQLLTPAPTDSPQGLQVIESAIGTVTSQPFLRQGQYLVVETYASGVSPAATVTVLDNSKGGTPTQAVDPQASRVLSGNYNKYVLGGLQDEIVVRVAPTAGVWAVRVSWTEGSPGAGQGILAASYVNESANIATLATAVTVGLAVLPLPATPLANRRAIVVYNNGTVPIYVGDAAVTTATGILVAAGSSISLNLGPAALLYGISGSGGQNVRVLESS